MKKFACLVTVFLISACDGGKPGVIYTKSCFLDAPVVSTTLSTKNDFNVAGWMFDKQSANSQGHIRVQLVSPDRKFVKLFDSKSVSRPDVANALNDPSAITSGFNLIIPANALTPSVYEITILQDLPSVIAVCENLGKIVVTE